MLLYNVRLSNVCYYIISIQILRIITIILITSVDAVFSYSFRRFLFDVLQRRNSDRRQRATPRRRQLAADAALPRRPELYRSEKIRNFFSSNNDH